MDKVQQRFEDSASRVMLDIEIGQTARMPTRAAEPTESASPRKVIRVRITWRRLSLSFRSAYPLSREEFETILLRR